MPRQMLERSELNPNEIRVAMMRCANASFDTIAIFLGTSEANVRHMLRRPHVARYMMAVQATYAHDMKQPFKDLETRINDYADNAFDVETKNMSRLDDLADKYEDKDPKISIRAAMGAAITAQDILDRAGKRAPAKSVNTNLHVIAPENIEHLGKVMSEVMSRGVGQSREENARPGERENSNLPVPVVTPTDSAPSPGPPPQAQMREEDYLP